MWRVARRWQAARIRSQREHNRRQTDTLFKYVLLERKLLTGAVIFFAKLRESVNIRLMRLNSIIWLTLLSYSHPRHCVSALALIRRQRFVHKISNTNLAKFIQFFHFHYLQWMWLSDFFYHSKVIFCTATFTFEHFELCNAHNRGIPLLQIEMEPYEVIRQVSFGWNASHPQYAVGTQNTCLNKVSVYLIIARYSWYSTVAGSDVALHLHTLNQIRAKQWALHMPCDSTTHSSPMRARFMVLKSVSCYLPSQQPHVFSSASVLRLKLEDGSLFVWWLAKTHCTTNWMTTSTEGVEKDTKINYNTEKRKESKRE